jgi:predicted nucleic acid-binding protein
LGASVTATLPVDNSAWVRRADPALPAERADQIAEALASGRIGARLPFLLGVGDSARDAREHAELLAELRSLPHYHLNDAVEERALDAQAQLARVGHHRLPPVDLLIAGLGDRHRLGILHYDHDYDLIASKTDLTFDSVWLATRGTFNSPSHWQNPRESVPLRALKRPGNERFSETRWPS